MRMRIYCMFPDAGQAADALAIASHCQMERQQLVTESKPKA